jgi:hypothetical protein
LAVVVETSGTCDLRMRMRHWRICCLNDDDQGWNADYRGE